MNRLINKGWNECLRECEKLIKDLFHELEQCDDELEKVDLQLRYSLKLRKMRRE